MVALTLTHSTALSSAGLMGDFGNRLFEPKCIDWASFHNRTIVLAIRDVGEDHCGLRLPPIKVSNARKSGRG